MFLSVYHAIRVYSVIIHILNVHETISILGKTQKRKKRLSVKGVPYATTLKYTCRLRHP
jgi:hypothetical protein